VAPRLLSNPRTPRYQKPVLQSYRLSPYLRETGRWPLRGEGEWRVGIRTCRQNPETVGPRPWISRLCSFQIRWATGSPLLCRCPARNLGFTEPCDHWFRRCACATSGHAAAAAPPSSVMNSRRLLIRSPRRRGREATPLELLERVQVVAVRILQTDHAGAPGLILRRPFKFHASCT